MFFRSLLGRAERHANRPALTPGATEVCAQREDITISALPQANRCGRSRLPSSQKTLAPSPVCSLVDRPAPPPHRPVFPLRGFRSCPPDPAVPHPTKFPPSTHPRASFPSPPSGGTLLDF